MDFLIDERLRRDCHVLSRFGVSWLLLHRSAALPWFILVPETTATELFDLAAAARRDVAAAADELGLLLRTELGCDKVNVAAIGNVVSQLHIHVVGRRRDDPCWPGVVWGRLEAGPERDPDALARIEGLVAGLSESRKTVT